MESKKQLLNLHMLKVNPCEKTYREVHFAVYVAESLKKPFVITKSFLNNQFQDTSKAKLIKNQGSAIQEFREDKDSADIQELNDIQ